MPLSLGDTGICGGGTPRRVAFFGGSFDPPHEGHLAIARAAHAALDLDQVLFAPVGAQPLKPDGASAGFPDRVAMARLAIDAIPGFGLSLIDAPRPDGKPNYTVDTLLTLHAQLPAGSELFFLMGADSLLGLSRWYRAAEIPLIATLIVASRPGEPFADIAAAMPSGVELLPAPDEKAASVTTASSGPETALHCSRLRGPKGEQALLYVLTGLHYDVGSTEVRHQLQLFTQGLAAPPASVPLQVMDYIRAHNLYSGPL